MCYIVLHNLHLFRGGKKENIHDRFRLWYKSVILNYQIISLSFYFIFTLLKLKIEKGEWALFCSISLNRKCRNFFYKHIFKFCSSEDFSSLYSLSSSFNIWIWSCCQKTEWNFFNKFQSSKRWFFWYTKIAISSPICIFY